MGYRVKDDVRVEINDPMFGTVSAKFKKGVVEPSNEQDERLLQHLVAQGLADVTETKEK